jgi:hypothetical protein
MAKFAVTVSNNKIVTATAQNETKARRKVEDAIAERGSKLTVTAVRLITGTVR